MTEQTWDDIPKGAYWKPEDIGDKIVGTITKVGVGTDFNNSPCPQICLDTSDGERIVNAGQANLKAQLLTLTPRPKPGDKIAITYSSTEKAAKGEKKIFTIVVKPGEPVAAATAAEDLF